MLVLRPSPRLVHRVSLPPLLVLLQLEALQLLVRHQCRYIRITLRFQLGRSSSCVLFLFPLGFQLPGIRELVPGSIKLCRRICMRH